MDNKKVNIFSSSFNMQNKDNAVECKYTINKSKKMIDWGNNMNYPQYLLDLYTNKGSSKHTSIINKKVDFTTGNGYNDLLLNEEINEWLYENDFNNLLTRINLDLEIFNGFAIEIIWNHFGQISAIKHMPISQLAIALVLSPDDKEGYWYSSDWSNTRLYKPEFIEKFNPYKREGKQIYYYVGYNPKNILYKYPIPKYSNSINSIELDYQIGLHNIKDVKKGFNAGYHINIPVSGVNDQTYVDELYESFIDKYTGPDAEEIVVTFTESGSSDKVEMTPFNNSINDNRFRELKQRIEEEIVIGAGIPAQLILLVTGKMGSTAERNELQEEFQNVYVSKKQTLIENELSNIFKYSIFGEFDIVLNKYKNTEITNE